MKGYVNVIAGVLLVYVLLRKKENSPGDDAQIDILLPDVPPGTSPTERVSNIVNSDPAAVRAIQVRAENADVMGSRGRSMSNLNASKSPTLTDYKIDPYEALLYAISGPADAMPLMVLDRVADYGSAYGVVTEK